MAADNKILGQFDLVGIPPSARGMPQIEVTFDIDANGIVNVSAKDQATGKEQQIRIQASGGLSDDDIERMVQEAEANAEADKDRRELVEIRNTADTLVHATEKNLSEFGDKISGEDKAAVETGITELKQALDGDNVDAIKSKTDALSEASMKLGEAMYKAAQSENVGENMAADDMGQPGKEQDPGAGSSDNVVDADFEEVDPDSVSKKKKDD